MRGLGVVWLAAWVVGCGGTEVDGPADPAGDDVELLFEPVGPDPAVVDAFAASIGSLPVVQAETGGHRGRLLNFHLLQDEDPQTGVIGPTSRFRAIYYDYEANRALDLFGDIGAPEAVVAVQTTAQPSPPLEEFQEAVELLLQDPELAARYADGEVRFLHSMPPLLDDEDGDRVITVGISYEGALGPAEIAGVNLSARAVVHFPGMTPPNASVTGFTCNPPVHSFEPGISRGTAGSARLRMRRQGAEVWSFNVTRPSVSSGTWGSGIEISDVRYRGKRILASAGVPILNVRYEGDTCGPYRDWQWQENGFMVGPIVSTPAPGIALVEWAKTMRELGDDSGNFHGVAAYFDVLREEIVLISELEAGWYRYATEWRFGLDGTIRPRFGFDAVENFCTCQAHSHHAYWRLDFHLGNGQNQFGALDPVSGAWSQIAQEAQLVRNTDGAQRWRVRDSLSTDSVLITPHAGEDPADSYGIADLWFVVDDPDEVDDAGLTAHHPTAAAIPQFVNGQSMVNVDGVLWWAGHFLHDDTDPTTNQTHTVEFTIRPESW
jgi:hypothetical protein